MATPQLSPGVLIREVDLTVGRADNVLDNIGAIAGPFPIGPVNEVVNITTENELLNTYGKPISTDSQYEYWMSASSFLSYGGVLKVTRCDGDDLKTANAALSGSADTNLKIRNYDEYEAEYADDENPGFIFAAKNPGTWGNGVKICVIDDRADQILDVGVGIATYATVGCAVTAVLTNVPSVGVGTTSLFTGTLNAIVTGVNTTAGTVDVKIVSLLSSANVLTDVTYANGDALRSFNKSSSVGIASTSGRIIGLNTSGGSSGVTTAITISSVKDWYDEQTLTDVNGTIYWRSIAPKPVTTKYSLDRSGRNDAINIVVIDNEGKLTGIQGNIIEKHIGLSKSSDSVSATNSPQKTWWKNYIALNSKYLFAGDNPSSTETVSTGFSSGFTAISTADGLWNQPAQSVTFSALGNKTYTLEEGNDYGNAGGMQADLGGIITAYNLFLNKYDHEVDYLIMGPGLLNKIDSAAKAQYLISIANQRKDCVAVISPHREDVVDVLNNETQTTNVIEFFNQIGSSSSYAIFDSGYKYTYDRFNNKFRYVPCNPDVAGLMTRTNIQAFPWFSPAGQQRGILNNAIKLAYNPNQDQRDRLYTARVNAIVNLRGTGILLYGDKTALSYASALDRINVRRLFLTIEQALERTAQSQLFEVNDEITRANFVNIVEPYLRDIQAKRGLYGFLVVCDSTNNTPDVIDNNEFRADIYLKPTKSINYVTLTFIATRTGTSFEEVAGTV